MDVIEKAIRNAFEKGDPGDQAFRLKVYRSAFTVLERAIAATDGTTPEEAEARREALKRKIAEIEGEFVPAVEVEPRRADAPAAPTVRIEPSLSTASGAGSSASAPRADPPLSSDALVEPVPAGPKRDPSSAPPVEAARREGLGGGGDFEPSIELDGPSAVRERDDALVGAAPVDGTSRMRRRRSYGGLVAALVVVAAAGGALWWAADGGLLSGGDTGPGGAPPSAGTPNAPAGGDEGPLKEGETEGGGNGITIFTPGDPTSVVAPAGSEASAMEKDGVAFLRIRSKTSGTEVSFDVGQGVLENIAGKHAVFDIVAQTENGTRTQMSVSCDFGALGDCGRKRYQVGDERNDFLFEMDMPNKRPGGAGRIMIDSDIDGQGKPVDILEIRVSTAK